MVEGKGTPTASYLTMRLMRLLGVEAGSLKTVALKNIWNLRTILEIRRMMKDKPTLTKAQAARSAAPSRPRKQPSPRVATRSST